MFHPFYLLLVLILSFNSSCTKEKKQENYNPELSSKMVKEGALLIDVRTVGEYKSGHVKGAVNIPHKEIFSKKNIIEQLTKNDKKTPIVLYCKSGGRASVAQKTLKNLGYEKVINHGGMSTWKKD